MDDGFMNHTGYSIATNCFSNEDIKIIMQFFIDKYDIYINVHRDNVIYIRAKDRDKFTKIIKPYIHNDCLYKLHNCPV